MSVRLCDSGKYKEYLEVTEHIENDLQIFCSLTEQLINCVSKVQYITLCTRKAKKRCSRIALTRDPTVFNVSFPKNPTESAKTLYCQKLESLPKICAADSIDSMCLSLLVCTQLFFEVARSRPAKPV